MLQNEHAKHANELDAARKRMEDAHPRINDVLGHIRTEKVIPDINHGTFARSKWRHDVFETTWDDGGTGSIMNYPVIS